MISDPDRHRLLAGISRVRLLAALRRSGEPKGVRELAAEVGLHANTAREHLERLVRAGLVEREVAAPSGRGRPPLRYRATPEGATEDPDAYRALAAVLAEELASRPDGARAATAAGERWGRSLAAGAGGRSPTVGTRGTGPRADSVAEWRAGTNPALEPLERLIDLLDEAGFAPEHPGAPGDPIRLRRCPFGSLARQRGDVVCAVHLGFLRGALRELGAPFDAVRLEPFVTPDLCLAYVTARPDAGSWRANERAGG